MKQLLMSLLLVGLVSFANAAVIGTDGFDYDDGAIVGDGGTGWDGGTGVSDWGNLWGATDVVSGELVTNNGGALREYAEPEGDGAIQASGQVYFAVTMTVSSVETFAGWAGASSYDFGTERIFFGHPWQDGALGNYGIDITGVENVVTAIPVVQDQAARIVGCVDFDGDQVLLWVNPDSSDFDYGSGNNSADAALAYTATNWSTAVRLASGSAVGWDDLIVATDPESVGIVPEPATMAMLGLGALLGLRRKK